MFCAAALRQHTFPKATDVPMDSIHSPPTQLVFYNPQDEVESSQVETNAHCYQMVLVLLAVDVTKELDVFSSKFKIDFRKSRNRD